MTPLSTEWIVVAAAVGQILATAGMMIGVYVRLIERIRGIEIKVDALWTWFVQRSIDPRLRKTD
jgi:hypothetical protein